MRAILDRLLASRDFRSGEFTVQEIPAQPAQHADYPAFVPAALTAALRERGIARPYAHQAEAWEAAHRGENVVVVTPTASGKTLCYNVPVLTRLLSQPEARAIYLFPTKALANDQMTELHDLIMTMGREIKTHTFDGDTPADARKAIREVGNVIVTNPDMLHQGILPHHTKWMRLFENLDYVVIDELHTYRGVFGSHLANVLRRLKRIAAFYGRKPQFIACSATIANPREHAEALVEAPFHLVGESGAPRGAKTFILYNPPVVNAELGIRKGALSQARRIARRFINKRVQTIVFTTSRQSVEVLTKYLKDIFEDRLRRPGSIRGYRGGYLPNLRREIEQGLRDGTVTGVVSTNALELGIDIGQLEVCVIAGYPGTIASTLQQAGRAGRRQGHSAVFLVARSNPLDQFIVTNPDFLFGSDPERALIEANNVLILMGHLKCAAFELPFKRGEGFGKVPVNDTEAVLDYLHEQTVLSRTTTGWHWMSDAYPADQVSLRSVSAENFVVIDTTAPSERVIAEVDFDSAHLTLYPKAIYMLESQTYQVERLDYSGRKAYVRAIAADHYTEAIDHSRINILEVFESKSPREAAVEWGEVHRVRHVAGYKKIKFYTLENVGFGEVSLPDQEVHTTSYWITLPQPFLRNLDLPHARVIDGLTALGYALRHIAATLLMCDIRDLGHAVGDKSAAWFALAGGASRGVYAPSGPDGKPALLPVETLDRFEPTLFLYDNIAGGIGFSHQLFDAQAKLMARCRKAIAHCPCTEGCPSCVGPSKELGTESKKTALALLDLLIEQGDG